MENHDQTEKFDNCNNNNINICFGTSYKKLEAKKEKSFWATWFAQ